MVEHRDSSRRATAAAELRGRTDECALLDTFVDAIRRGEGQSLVVRGQAGIGKTALLEYLVQSASDLTVLRAVGVEYPEATTGRFPLGWFVACEVLCTGALVASVILWM